MGGLDDDTPPEFRRKIEPKTDQDALDHCTRTAYVKACQTLEEQPPVDITEEVIAEVKKKHPPARSEDRANVGASNAGRGSRSRTGIKRKWKQPFGLSRRTLHKATRA